MTARIATALLGIWLMVAPDVLGYEGATRINDRVVGPLVVATAIMAATEVTRPLRWLGVPLGAWLLAAPWVLGYADALARADSIVAGVLVIVLSLIRGTVHGRFGGGWSSLWRTAALDADRSPTDSPAWTSRNDERQ